MNEVIKAIHSRRSIGKLSLPMPNQDELTLAIQTAMTAPDHKQLKPWQLTVLTDDGLEAFGQALLCAGQQKATAQDEILDETTCTKLINMPKRAPMIIMVATDIKEHDKVPPFEQLLSTGAFIQTLLLALQSLGYQSIWRTGELTNEPAIKEFFGVADKDTICGFVYVGTSEVVMPERALVNLSEFVKIQA